MKPWRARFYVNLKHKPQSTNYYRVSLNRVPSFQYRRLPDTRRTPFLQQLPHNLDSHAHSIHRFGSHFSGLVILDIRLATVSLLASFIGSGLQGWETHIVHLLYDLVLSMSVELSLASGTVEDGRPSANL